MQSEATVQPSSRGQTHDRGCVLHNLCSAEQPIVSDGGIFLALLPGDSFYPHWSTLFAVLSNIGPVHRIAPRAHTSHSASTVRPIGTLDTASGKAGK